MKSPHARIVIAGVLVALLSIPSTTIHAGNLSIGATDFARLLGPGGASVTRILYNLQLPDTLANSRIDRAVLRLSLASDTVLEDFTLIALPVVDNWTGGGATLALSLGIVDSISEVYASRLSPGDTVQFDITHLVKAWASGQIACKGLMLQPMTDEPEPLEIPGKLAYPPANQVQLEVWFTPRTEP